MGVLLLQSFIYSTLIKPLGVMASAESGIYRGWRPAAAPGYERAKRTSYIFAGAPEYAWAGGWGPRNDLGPALPLAKAQFRGNWHSPALVRHLFVSWIKCFLWKGGCGSPFCASKAPAAGMLEAEAV